MIKLFEDEEQVIENLFIPVSIKKYLNKNQQED